MGGQPTAYGGACGRGEGRVQAINIERLVDRVISYPGADHFGNDFWRIAMHLTRFDHLESHDVVVGGAQADLH